MQLSAGQRARAGQTTSRRRSIAPQALLSGLTAALTGNKQAARDAKKAEVERCVGGVCAAARSPLHASARI